MTAFFLIAIVGLNGLCLAFMLYHLRQDHSPALPLGTRVKLVFSGIVAFIADTLGIGSFACNISMAKLLGTFPEEQMPAVNNGAQILPGLLEAVFFIHIIAVDALTMITLVSATCIGGILGGFYIARINDQAIRLTMMLAFSLIILLLAGHQLGLLPPGGEQNALSGWHLLVGFCGLLICGALTAAGVGLFVMVQAVLFMLNVSPLVAFPIMSTAGALQQPLTTMIFVQHGKIPLRKTLLLSVAGCIGVLLVIPFFRNLKISWLHSLLLLLLCFNLFHISQSYLKQRKTHKIKRALTRTQWLTE
ncbi:MAG: sulfite exporter TauE/SafE family protein [Legionellaceae bacterium]|nr:sulfite exporter TauE/SafE family protein [Legionellaceae bacterium]